VAASDWEIPLAAVLTGMAGIVSAAGGVLLAIHAVRDKERKQAKADYEQISAQLHAERAARVRVEELAYTQRLLLAQHGVPLPPEPADDRDPDPAGAHGVPAPVDRVHRRRADARRQHRRGGQGGQPEQ
jgi:hypothetical protein